MCIVFQSLHFCNWVTTISKDEGNTDSDTTKPTVPIWISLAGLITQSILKFQSHSSYSHSHKHEWMVGWNITVQIKLNVAELAKLDFSGGYFINKMD